MPKIFEPKDLPALRRNNADIATLADRVMLGTDALQVDHIRLEANARSDIFGSPEPERFLFVLQGGGRARVQEEDFPLEPESVLWLEAGESFDLEAGADGLTVLFCRAPAGE